MDPITMLAGAVATLWLAWSALMLYNRQQDKSEIQQKDEALERCRARNDKFAAAIIAATSSPGGIGEMYKEIARLLNEG